MRSMWPDRCHLAYFTSSLMGRHRQRRYSAVFEMWCSQWMPMIWRRWRRWYASNRSSSTFVRPQVPMLYINTGTTKDPYNRSRNSRLIRLNHTVDRLRKATFARCFHRATSSAFPSSDPSLRVMWHSSSTRSANTRPSVLDALMVSDHSARQAGAIRLMSSRNKRDVLMKSVSSAYSTSSGKLASARGRVGMCDRRSRRAASR